MKKIMKTTTVCLKMGDGDIITSVPIPLAKQMRNEIVRIKKDMFDDLLKNTRKWLDECDTNLWNKSRK